MSKRPSALVDTGLIYSGENLHELRKLPSGCIERKVTDGQRTVEAIEGAEGKWLIYKEAVA